MLNGLNSQPAQSGALFKTESVTIDEPMGVRVSEAGRPETLEDAPDSNGIYRLIAVSIVQ